MNIVRTSDPLPGLNGRSHIAGVDEAGRGPLAGPVVVAAVVLPENHGLAGLDDSKKLSGPQREGLYEPIRRTAVSWCIEAVEVEEIEALNILGATLSGMRRAVHGLEPAADAVLVDGNRVPELAVETHAVIKGDGRVAAISAASVLAKVYRDRLMRRYHEQWPDYGFDRHMGYPTADHLKRLERYGPCPIHRRSFAPVRQLLTPGLI